MSTFVYSFIHYYLFRTRPIRTAANGTVELLVCAVDLCIVCCRTVIVCCRTVIVRCRTVIVRCRTGIVCCRTVLAHLCCSGLGQGRRKGSTFVCFYLLLCLLLCLLLSAVVVCFCLRATVCGITATEHIHVDAHKCTLQQFDSTQ